MEKYSNLKNSSATIEKLTNEAELLKKENQILHKVHLEYAEGLLSVLSKGKFCLELNQDTSAVLRPCHK
jgi:hypothetical protein